MLPVFLHKGDMILEKLMDFEPFCDNDDVYCKCRVCAESVLNGGTCSRCTCCVDGSYAMDCCESFKEMRCNP